MKVSSKLIAAIAIIVCVVLVVFLIQQRSEINQLEQYRDTSIERIKAEKDSIIQHQLIRIDSLLIDNNSKDLVVDRLNHDVDSLQIARDSIRVVFKYKYKEIDGFNAIDLEKYWKDEFKK
jgi:hypothetical protein